MLFECVCVCRMSVWLSGKLFYVHHIHASADFQGFANRKSTKSPTPPNIVHRCSLTTHTQAHLILKIHKEVKLLERDRRTNL